MSMIKEQDGFPGMCLRGGGVGELCLKISNVREGHLPPRAPCMKVGFRLWTLNTS